MLWFGGVKERFIITNGIQHLLWATEFSVIVMNMSICWKCPFGHNFCLGGILNLDCSAVEVRAFKERNDTAEVLGASSFIWYQVVSKYTRRKIYYCTSVYMRYKTIHIWCSIVHKVGKSDEFMILNSLKLHGYTDQIFFQARTLTLTKYYLYHVKFLVVLIFGF